MVWRLFYSGSSAFNYTCGGYKVIDLNCSLCNALTTFLASCRNKDYYHCDRCLAVMMDPKDHLTFQEEKKRYDQHNNDIYDPGYQKFVRPMVDAVVSAFGPQAAGLDYGAGPGPVAAHLLEQHGYELNLYDPFYWPDRKVFSRKYDYIIASEVVEHFRSPYSEFMKLHSLLLPGGAIFCMTELISGEEDFADWYYKNDPTHLFFYHVRTLEWIRKEFNFQQLIIKGRLQILFNP